LGTIDAMTMGLTGQSMVIEEGIVYPQFYANVDTGTNKTYSNVTTGTNKTYSNVATGTNRTYTDVSTE
jgi:hypothetical protein